MRSPVVPALAALVLGGAGCATAETPRTSALAAVPAPAPAPPPPPALARGSRGSDAVGHFVRERNAQLQFCYEEARSAQPALAGTLTVGVTLERDGRVQAGAVVRRSWAGDGDAVERCVLATVRRWRFPALEDDAVPVHSFVVIFSGADAGSR